jgi:hypothetical protein
MALQVIAEKRPLGDRKRGKCEREMHFPLPIIILAQDARADGVAADERRLMLRHNSAREGRRRP